MSRPVPDATPAKGAWKVPRPTNSLTARRPVPLKTGHSQPTWRFSFRFWKQRKHFELGGKQPGWFISLLERLAVLSNDPIDQFDSRKLDVIRCHKVDWGARNAPIQRTDLELSAEYLNDEENYPLLQFSVSTALGRVVGFWDEHNVFNVVLLDPFHNLNPGRETNWKVTAGSPAKNEHEDLLEKLGRIYATHVPKCTPGNCTTFSALRTMHLDHQPACVVYLDAEYYAQARRIMEQRKFNSIEQLLELRILEIDTSAPTQPEDS